MAEREKVFPSPLSDGLRSSVIEDHLRRRDVRTFVICSSRDRCCMDAFLCQPRSPSREHALRTDPTRTCLSAALPRSAGTIAVASLLSTVSVGPSGCFRSRRGQAWSARPGHRAGTCLPGANTATSCQAQPRGPPIETSAPCGRQTSVLTRVRLLPVMSLSEQRKRGFVSAWVSHPACPQAAVLVPFAPGLYPVGTSLSVTVCYQSVVKSGLAVNRQ